MYKFCNALLSYGFRSDSYQTLYSIGIQKGIFSNRNNKAYSCMEIKLASYGWKIFLLKILLNLDDKVLSVLIFWKIFCEKDPKLTAWKLAKQFNTSYTSIIKYLKEFRNVSTLSSWIIHHLNASQLNQISSAHHWRVDLLLNHSWVESSPVMETGFSIIISSKNNND